MAEFGNRLAAIDGHAHAAELDADARLAHDALAPLVFPLFTRLLARWVEFFAVGGQIAGDVFGRPSGGPGAYRGFHVFVACTGGTRCRGSRRGGRSRWGRCGSGGRCWRLRCRHYGRRSGHRRSRYRRLLPLGCRRKQVADQGQLGLHCGVAAVQLQRFAVGLAGQLGVYVAQVLMRSGIAGVGAYGHFKRGAGLVKKALVGIQHGQVVVGLGQLGVVFGQLGEGGNRVLGLARLRLDHTLQKAHLRVTWLARQVLVGLAQCFGVLACTQQAVNVGVVIGPCHARAERGAQGEPLHRTPKGGGREAGARDLGRGEGDRLRHGASGTMHLKQGWAGSLVRALYWVGL